MQTIYQVLPVKYLQRGRYQPRVNFDIHAIQELALSLSTHGLIEPLIVREIAGKRYEIIAGERRWRAAMLAGMSEVPCLIGNYSDEQAATLTLVENLQREELTLLEEARGYQRLQEEFHFHQQEIATLVSKSRSHIANILRLLTLNTSVQSLIDEGKLTFGHARLLVGLSNELQYVLALQVVGKGWSVRHLEEKIKTYKTIETRENGSQKTPDIVCLENQLAEQLGSPVQIILRNDQSGWLQIKFFDNETFTGILERMGLSSEE